MNRKSGGILISVTTFIFAVYFVWFLADGAPSLANKVPSSAYRYALALTWPVAEKTYDSGTERLTYYDELLAGFGRLFGFEPGKPYTYFNVTSGINLAFYEKIYRSWIADAEKDFIENKKLDYTKDNFYSSSEAQPEPAQNGSGDGGTGSVGSVPAAIQITNDTGYKINVAALRLEPLKLTTPKSGPRVFIYHTHTTESYISVLTQLDSTDIPSWNQDPSMNITRIGSALVSNLENRYGIATIFSRTVHDWPNYGSAYINSLKTLENTLKTYPSLSVVLDIHRDGIDENGEKLRLVTDIGGKQAARIMFVVGTDESGLAHPNWRENLKLAIRLQDILNRDHPGLARPIYLSPYRFNQHVSNGALIIEIGGDGNLFDEAVESTRYIADALAEILNVSQ